MDIVWDGITRSETLSDPAIRNDLANSAKLYDWARTVAIIREYPGLVNTTRPSGKTRYAPLHQAAHGNAPLEVVQQLIDLGAWRSLQNVRGERPVDIANQKSHQFLVPALTPEYKHIVPPGVLLQIQRHFHEVIFGRAEELVEKHALRLPELETLLELERPQMWFPVPGMYGGFNYHLEPNGTETVLIAGSWCRVVGGSGQRHEITSSGSRLVDEGFV